MRHPAPITSYLLSIICLSLFATSTMSACTRSGRNDTIKATLVAVNAAKDGLADYDARHQTEIVAAATTADEAREKVAAYRGERDKLAAGFEVAYRTLAFAATQNDQPSLDTAIVLGRELVSAVNKFIGLVQEQH